MIDIVHIVNSMQINCGGILKDRVWAVVNIKKEKGGRVCIKTEEFIFICYYKFTHTWTPNHLSL